MSDPKTEPVIRLNNAQRIVLIEYAKKIVDVPVLRAKIDAAHAAMLTEIRAVIVAAYPVRDMNVLARYEGAKHNEIIEVRYPKIAGEGWYCADRPDANSTTVVRSGTRGRVTRYDDLDWLPGEGRFRLPVPAGLMIPDRMRYVVLDRDSSVIDAYLGWRRAVDKLREARAAKIRDYTVLVHASKTFEDVVKVWSDAVGIMGDIEAAGATTARPLLPVVADATLLQRIKSDVAARRNRAPVSA